MYRVFESLDALVTVVEEARGVPMTSTCVVPRGDLLDLLDELREALPGELDDAQDVLDHRDDLLSRAERKAAELTEQAEAEAARLVADARAEAEQLVGAARHEADRAVAAGRAEYQDLVDRGRVEAERLAESGRATYDRAVAEAHAEQARLVSQTEVVQAAHIESGRIIDAGERESDRLRAECDHYVSSSLAGFEDTLARTLQTVQRGRGQWEHGNQRSQPPGPVGMRGPIGADLID